jgi:hypothetical protein
MKNKGKWRMVGVGVGEYCFQGPGCISKYGSICSGCRVPINIENRQKIRKKNKEKYEQYSPLL